MGKDNRFGPNVTHLLGPGDITQRNLDRVAAELAKKRGPNYSRPPVDRAERHKWWHKRLADGHITLEDIPENMRAPPGEILRPTTGQDYLDNGDGTRVCTKCGQSKEEALFKKAGQRKVLKMCQSCREAQNARNKAQYEAKAAGKVLKPGRPSTGKHLPRDVEERDRQLWGETEMVEVTYRIPVDLEPHLDHVIKEYQKGWNEKG